MAFDLDELRIERLNVEVAYHATYTFYGLKGALAERWAHGPVFGAVGEVGTGQLNLTPPSDEVADQRLVAVVGLRVSGLLAEGQLRTPQARTIAPGWFDDIYTVLKPQRTVSMRADLFALYPVRDPHAATRRLISRYYNADALSAFAESDRFFAAVDVIAADEQPQRSAIMGVVGPPHRGAYFTFPDDDRDSRWWMGLRLHYGAHDEDGIPDPLATLRTSLDGLYGDVSRLARSGLAAILADG